MELNLPDVDKANVGFMYESRGLDSVMRTFAAQASARDVAQLGIHELYNSCERAVITVAPGAKKPGYFRGRWQRHRLAFPQNCPISGASRNVAP